MYYPVSIEEGAPFLGVPPGGYPSPRIGAVSSQAAVLVGKSQGSSVKPSRVERVQTKRPAPLIPDRSLTSSPRKRHMIMLSIITILKCPSGRKSSKYATSLPTGSGLAQAYHCTHFGRDRIQVPQPEGGQIFVRTPPPWGSVGSRSRSGVCDGQHSAEGSCFEAVLSNVIHERSSTHR